MMKMMNAIVIGHPQSALHNCEWQFWYLAVRSSRTSYQIVSFIRCVNLLSHYVDTVLNYMHIHFVFFKLYIYVHVHIHTHTHGDFAHGISYWIIFLC